MDELLPTVRDLITQDYLAIPRTADLLEAVRAIERHVEDTAFVLDDDHRLVGILSEKDCLRTLAARAYDAAAAESVQDVMCAAPAVLTPGTDAYAAAQAFLSCSCGMLPVLEDGRVVGAISQLAMLRAFIQIFQHRTQSLGEAEQTADDLSGRPEAKEQMQRVAANLDRDQLATLFRQSTRKND
jgi:signal-transduction protein with cAMP-binding, CBS, and nucleotidyltransferase domain